MTSDGAPIFRSLARLKQSLSRMGARRLVLANGCFDPLHVGHVRYLCDAKKAGDCLVVAINDDRTTRELKGAGRPIMSAQDRARIVSSLEVVDAVLIFSARDVRGLLKALRPSVHAKGTDYTTESVPERETSAALGIETRIAGDAKSHASRDVVRRMRRSKRGTVKPR